MAFSSSYFETGNPSILSIPALVHKKRAAFTRNQPLSAPDFRLVQHRIILLFINLFIITTSINVYLIEKAIDTKKGRLLKTIRGLAARQ